MKSFINISFCKNTCIKYLHTLKYTSSWFGLLTDTVIMFHSSASGSEQERDAVNLSA
jgi:hypothetical protein